MTYRTRQRIAAVVSLFLMVFSICQAQARAFMLPVSVQHEVMTACHQSSPDLAVHDCHTGCEHLQQHHEAGGQNQPSDFHPVLIAILDPFLPMGQHDQLNGTRYQPPDPLQADVPASIRLQRFLN